MLMSGRVLIICSSHPQSDRQAVANLIQVLGHPMQGRFVLGGPHGRGFGDPRGVSRTVVIAPWMAERNDGVHFAAEHPTALRCGQRDGHRVRLGLDVTYGRDLDFVAYVQMHSIPDESARSVSTVGVRAVGAHEPAASGGPVSPTKEVGRLPRPGAPRVITQSEAVDVDRGVAERKRTAD